jgi:hypothetical protein
VDIELKVLAAIGFEAIRKELRKDEDRDYLTVEQTREIANNILVLLAADEGHFVAGESFTKAENNKI